MAVNTPAVVAGELITSAWGNTVRADLLGHDATLTTLNTQMGTKAGLAGATFTGNVFFGSAASSTPGAAARADGALLSYLSDAGGSGTNSSNLNLARGGTNTAAAGGLYIRFARGAGNTSGNDVLIGSVVVNSGGNGVNYNQTSDYRLKRELGPVADALSRLLGLRPIRFAWNDNGAESDGFLAHEVARVVPEAVTGDMDAVDDDGRIVPQQLDTHMLVPLLVAAVQQLAAQVAELSGK